MNCVLTAGRDSTSELSQSPGGGGGGGQGGGVYTLCSTGDGTRWVPSRKKDLKLTDFYQGGYVESKWIL